MKHATTTKLSTTLLLLAGFGCAGDPQVNLGDTAVTGEALADYAADWTGYAQAYVFADGHDSVRLSLDELGQGVIEFGSDAPAAFDPTFGYLSSIDTNDVLPALFPGFSYPVTASIADERRLQVVGSYQDPYEDWCASFDVFETTASDNSIAYTCVDPAYVAWGSQDGACFFETTDGTHVPTACSRTTCWQRCGCDAEGCYSGDYPGATLLDGTLRDSGDTLSATLLIHDQRITVELTRN